MQPDTLKSDPTQTTTLRRSFMQAVAARFRNLRGAHNDLLVGEDAFGLRGDNRALPASAIDQYLVANTRWAFLTDDKKMQAYRDWLTSQTRAGILGVPVGADAAAPWTSDYIESAYKKGMIRSYVDVRKARGGGDGPAAAAKEEFLRNSFATPVAQQRLRLLYTRTYSQLEGITAAMDQELSRVLAQGLSAGRGPRELARDINNSISGIEKRRALVMARTEIIHSYAEGQLDSLEALGVGSVAAHVEWTTAGDHKVCPLCKPLQGIVLTIKEARGLIPRHPNCRCAWVPAVVGEDPKGSVYAGDEIQARLRESIKKEHPKLTAAAARKASKWRGADVKASHKSGLKLTKAKAAQLDQAIADAKAGLVTKTAAQAQAARDAAAAAQAAQAAAEAKAAADAAQAAADARAAAQAAQASEAEAAAAQAAAAAEAEAAALAKQAAEQRALAAVTKASHDLAVDTAKVHKKNMKVWDDWDSDLPQFTATGLQDHVQYHYGYALDADQVVAVLAAADDVPDGVAPIAAQLAKLDDTLQGALADAQSLTAAWYDSSIAGPVDLVDLADYSGIGWVPAKGGLTQSYGTILFDDQGRVMLRKSKGGFGGADWTFAKGGGSKPGTTALAELGEETGHTATLHGAVPGTYKGTTTQTNYFFGKSSGYDKALMDTETEAVEWFTYEEAIAAIKQSPNKQVVQRDLDVLHAAYKQASKVDNPVEWSDLLKSGQAAADQVKKDAQSNLVKKGMAKSHYAKPKFGGGVVYPADYDTPDKLGTSGLNKVLGEKGWHTTTLPTQTVQDLVDAPDIVAQKAILDKLKKAPKGTTVPPPVSTAAGYDSDGNLLDTYIEAELAKAAPGMSVVDTLNAIDEIHSLPKAMQAAALQTKLAMLQPTGPVPLPATFALPDPRTLKKVKDLPGSTRPYLAVDPSGGKWVVKSIDAGINPDHLRSEALADTLYRQAGLPVPKGGILQEASGPLKVTEFLEGGQTLADWSVGKTKAQVEAMYKQVQKGFVADALFANHDVVGLSLDNVFIVGKTAYRIDNGGALLYRAQGAAKRGFGSKVAELTSMRDASVNSQTAKVFGSITDGEVHDQIRDLLARRAAIVGAIEDDDLAAIINSRLDDLATKLPPAPVVTRTIAGNVPRTEYGIQPSTPARIEASRINGTNIATDRGDIEDNNILVWSEQDAAGNPVVKVHFKVTQAGSSKVVTTLGPSLQKVATAAQTSYASYHPADKYWDTLLAGVKTVAVHAKDGKYNEVTMKGVVDAKAALQAALASKPDAGTKAMLGHYLAVADDILEAKRKGGMPGAHAKYVVPPPKAAKPAAPADRQRRRRWSVSKGGELRHRTSTFTNGRAKASGGVNTFAAKEFYEIDGGEGVRVTFMPNNGLNEAAKENGSLAMQGTITVAADGPVSHETIQKAMQAIADLGLDTTPPTPAYEELLYLHRGVNVRKHTGDPKYKAIWENTSLSDEDKVTAIKAWAGSKYGVDFKNPEFYDPHGTTKTSFGDGYRHWYRWDVTPGEVERKMDGYTLQHTTGGLYQSGHGSVPKLVGAVLQSGGEFTPTASRVRKGVSVAATGGGSSKDDMRTGGASFFFTRLRKDKEATDTMGFFFKRSRLARQDVVSYDQDRYGNMLKLGERYGTVDEYKQITTYSGNETLFKEGLSLLDDIDYIRVWSEQERLDTIEAFARNKVTHLTDGRAVTDIVVVRDKLPKPEHRAKNEFAK